MRVVCGRGRRAPGFTKSYCQRHGRRGCRKDELPTAPSATCGHRARLGHLRLLRLCLGLRTRPEPGAVSLGRRPASLHLRGRVPCPHGVTGWWGHACSPAIIQGSPGPPARSAGRSRGSGLDGQVSLPRRPLGFPTGDLFKPHLGPRPRNRPCPRAQRQDTRSCWARCPGTLPARQSHFQSFSSSREGLPARPEVPRHRSMPVLIWGPRAGRGNPAVFPASGTQ